MLRFKTFIWGVILIGVLAGTYFFTKEEEKKVDPAIQATINKYKTPDGRFADILNELKVEGTDDVRFSRKNGLIILKYGEMQFEIKENDLAVETLRQNLQLLGVEMLFLKDGRFVVKYKGEVVKEIE